MTSMTPNPDQNAAQNTVQDSAAQQGGTTQQGGTQRSARSLMNSLYRSPRALKNGAPDAEDTVPLAIAGNTGGGTCRRNTCRARGIRPRVEWLG